MKKILSLILALALVATCCALFSAPAKAEGNVFA